MAPSALPFVVRAFAGLAALLGCASPTLRSDDAALDLDGAERRDGRDVTGDLAVDRSPGEVPESGAIGGPCVARSCPAGLTCLTEQSDYPNGYCAQPCDARGGCPAGAVCLQRGPLGATCMRACRSNADCRALEGYECAGNPRLCRPVLEPLGTRDGAACFTTTPGPWQLAPLPRRTFVGTNRSLSAERTDSVSEADGNLVIDPLRGVLATPYIAASQTGSFIGTSALDGDGGLTFGRVDDPVNPWTADPVLVHARGALFVSFMGYRLNGFLAEDTRMRVARSSEDGARWSTATAIDPPGHCDVRCDKPWLASGPLRGRPEVEAFYAAWQVLRTQDAVAGELVVQRSEDGGSTWSAPVTLASVETVAGARVAPQLAWLTVAPDGIVHALYAGVTPGGVSATLWGHPDARIVHRTSQDNGATWSAPHSVAREEVDTVVYVQPALALLGSSIHVVYVSGRPWGAWDVLLASSRDGGVTWRHRRVNDDPETCATHTLPTLAADPARGLVHVLWLENRFGDGAAVYAACPDDPALPCRPNEQVSDAPFTFNTSRDIRRWHGDYLGLAVDRGRVFAVWSDTRTGSPAVYLAQGRP